MCTGFAIFTFMGRAFGQARDNQAVLDALIAQYLSCRPSFRTRFAIAISSAQMKFVRKQFRQIVTGNGRLRSVRKRNKFIPIIGRQVE